MEFVSKACANGCIHLLMQVSLPLRLKEVKEVLQARFILSFCCLLVAPHCCSINTRVSLNVTVSISLACIFVGLLKTWSNILWINVSDVQFHTLSKDSQHTTYPSCISVCVLCSKLGLTRSSAYLCHLGSGLVLFISFSPCHSLFSFSHLLSSSRKSHDVLSRLHDTCSFSLTKPFEWEVKPHQEA